MQTAKLFQNGRSQAVRLPKEYQFAGEEVLIQKHGAAVLLLPHEKAWEVFMEGLNSFSADFMRDGRDPGRGSEKGRLVMYLLDTNICIFAISSVRLI